MGFEYIEVSSPDWLSSVVALAQRWISGQRRFKRIKESLRVERGEEADVGRIGPELLVEIDLGGQVQSVVSYTAQRDFVSVCAFE